MVVASPIVVRLIRGGSGVHRREAEPTRIDADVKLYG
jgi:hypothetical protein